MNAAAWTPATEGRITELSPSLLALMPVIDNITVISNLELRNAYTTGNHASSNCTFLSCSRAKRTEGRLRARDDCRPDRCPRHRHRHTDAIARNRHGSHRASRQLRQRLRVRLSEQPVLVVADVTASNRGRSARRFRAAVWRWRKPRGTTRRAQEERQHPRLDDERSGSTAARARCRRSCSRRPIPRFRARGSSDASSAPNRAMPQRCPISIVRQACRRCGKTTSG